MIRRRLLDWIGAIHETSLCNEIATMIRGGINDLFSMFREEMGINADSSSPGPDTISMKNNDEALEEETSHDMAGDVPATDDGLEGTGGDSNAGWMIKLQSLGTPE